MPAVDGAGVMLAAFEVLDLPTVLAPQATHRGMLKSTRWFAQPHILSSLAGPAQAGSCLGGVMFIGSGVCMGAAVAGCGCLSLVFASAEVGAGVVL